MKVLSFVSNLWNNRARKITSKKLLLCTNIDTDSLDSRPLAEEERGVSCDEQNLSCKMERNLIDLSDENTDPVSPRGTTGSQTANVLLKRVSGRLRSSQDAVCHVESAYDSQVNLETMRCSQMKWAKGDLIGSGAFGKVYLGFNQETGHLMAVKQVQMPYVECCKDQIAEHVKALESEVAVLKGFHHPNIVRYLGTERIESSLNIFLEYAAGGSVASLLSKFGAFEETLIRSFTRQILKGLEYLHQNKTAHRDIKGGNILVDHQGVVKLADFGASKRIETLVTLNSGLKSLKGTPYWMAPEVIKQTGHGRQADIWSVGCTVIEMATGKPPWSEVSNNLSVMFHIASSKGPPPIPEHFSHEARDFLKLCFNRNPKERPNASRLLLHPFLANSISQEKLPQPRLTNILSKHSEELSSLESLTEGSSGMNSRDINLMEEPTVELDKCFMSYEKPIKDSSLKMDCPQKSEGIRDAFEELMQNGCIKKQWAIELEQELKELKNQKRPVVDDPPFF